MKVVTTQTYRNQQIIEQKRQQMIQDNIQLITLPVNAIGNTGFYALSDGHHRYEAAKQLGIEIKFEVINSESLEYGEYGNFHYDLDTKKCYFI